MTTAHHPISVVTYQTPTSGRKLRLCPACERRLREAGTWPHDQYTGEEYCQVHRGLTPGRCDECQRSE